MLTAGVPKTVKRPADGSPGAAKDTYALRFAALDMLNGERTYMAEKRKVFCVKFQREMEGMDEVPFEGHPLGQKIFDNVSKEAWKLWVEHMKMIMNEYRLNLGNPEAQEFLIQQMDNYFFGPGAALPPDFVPPASGEHHH